MVSTSDILASSSHVKNWILIRGLGRGSGHWGPFPEKLKQAFPDDSIYFVDVPGNGQLHKLDTPLKISEFISHLDEQLLQQNFNFQNPTYGYSLSLGSMAMVEWAQQRPDLFKKIYISNTSAANFSNVFKRLSVDALKLGFRMRKMKSHHERELASLLLTTTLSEQQILNDYKKAYESMIDFSHTHCARPRNILRQLIAAATYSFPSEPPVETILMSGGKDQFVSAKCSIDIEIAWQCPHIVHPEAGHDISFQFPDWVVEKLKATL